MEDEQIESLAKEHYPEAWYRNIDGDNLDANEKSREVFKHGLVLGFRTGYRDCLKEFLDETKNKS